MDYVREKAPPVREDRLQTCNAYGGNCCDLAGKSKQGCLIGARRTFAQAQGCQLNLSLAILNTIRDSVIIVHGPIGCGGSSASSAGINKNFLKLRDAGARDVPWINTNLGNNEVIGGGEANLRAAILHAEKEFRPSAIIIVNSCVPAIIGDDIDGVVAELQKEVNARLVPVHCEGFKTRISASAYDSVYHGILRNLVYPPEHEARVMPDELEDLKEKYRLSRTVNLLNVASMSRADEVELTRLLKALDLNLNIMPCYAHPDDFQGATEAALSVCICATHDDYFVEHLKERYGVPFIISGIPIGIRYTNQWIMEIARFFKLEDAARRLIAAETGELEQALIPYREVLRGKRVLIGAGEIRVLAMAELLRYLGLEVLGLRVHHYDKFADAMLSEMPDEKLMYNVATGQPFEQANLLARLQPDLFVGHTGANGLAAKQGPPIMPAFQQSGIYMGYNGVFEIARKLARKLRNPAFNRNLAANTRLPYVQEWYDQDPFSYIDTGDMPVGPVEAEQRNAG